MAVPTCPVCSASARGAAAIAVAAAAALRSLRLMGSMIVVLPIKNSMGAIHRRDADSGDYPAGATCQGYYAVVRLRFCGFATRMCENSHPGYLNRGSALHTR